MGLYLLVFFSILFSTFLSSMSGGGSTAISLPIFLWAGVPLPLAIAVHRVAAMFWTPFSAQTYLKGRKVDWTFLFLFAAIGLVGMFFGVQFITQVDAEVLSKVIGGIILIFVLYSALKKDLGLKEHKVSSDFKRKLSYFLALPMGFYEGLLGSGNGIAFAALTFYTRGFDLIHALGYYFAIAFFWVTFESVLLIQAGYFDWKIMLAGVLGSMVGSTLGSRLARFKGNRFVKRVFIVIGALLALKLLLS